ncbi:MAG: GNAT family N-acetyltransferase [Eubacteriaceae bacterium]|nr:GNAT family N-acetyltransferase [Eubacteriaceae bacterium]
MEFTIKPGYDYPKQIANLFGEYTQMVTRETPGFADYLKQQNYEAELAHPGEKYALPGGYLLIAFKGDKPAGCIALKDLGDDNCEMKRLYVREQYRKRGLGTALAKAVIERARQIGYKKMLLDTFDTLGDAVRLYEKLGFKQTEQYNDSPMKGAIYMALEL